MISFLLFILTLSLSGGLGQAKTNNPQMKYKGIDRNNDGVITREEWRSTSDAFNNLDTNRDNLLTENEFNSTQSSNIVERIFQEIFR